MIGLVADAIRWNVNEKFDFIVRSMKSLADTHTPVRKYTRRGFKLKSWITQGIISSIEDRDYLFRVYKRLKLLTDVETYKSFRNRLTNVKELTKRKYSRICPIRYVKGIRK